MQAVAGGFRVNFVLIKMPLSLLTTLFWWSWTVSISVINLGSSEQSEMLCEQDETLT